MMKTITLDKNTDYEHLFKQIKSHHKKLGVFFSATEKDLTIFFKEVNANQNIIVGVKINRLSNCIEVFSKNIALQNEFDEVIKGFAKKLNSLLDISGNDAAKEVKANPRSFSAKTPTAKTKVVEKEVSSKRKSTTQKSSVNYYTKALQNYAVFNGRARRSEYWYFVLFNFIISFVLGYVGQFVGLYNLSSLYSLAVLVPSIAVGVRRMHDVGKSGWFLLIPIYNLILACTDGVTGENEYGTNPKAVGNEASSKRKSTTQKSSLNYYTKALQNYAVFNGRARRSEYWYFVLFNFIISFVLGYVGQFVGLYNLSNLYSLAVLVPSIAVGVRRMHDVGKSGWFLLIPIYNLILACTDGVTGENEYGTNPKAVENDVSKITNTSTLEGNKDRVMKQESSPVNDVTSHKSSPVVTSDKLQKLREVKDLLDSGAITQCEFENLKAGILNKTLESGSPVRVNN